MEELNDIIKNKSNKNNTLFIKHDPLEKTNILLDILNKESNLFENESLTWNKLMIGYKKRYIIEYLNNNNLDESVNNDIMRNLYTNQLSKHYTIDYDIENKKVIDINKI